MTTRIRLRLFFEWGGGALWCGNDAAAQRFGVGPVEDRLDLPHPLLARIRALSAHHDTALNWSDPAAAGPWTQKDHDDFRLQVERLRTEIAETLGPEFDIVNEQFMRPS